MTFLCQPVRAMRHGADAHMLRTSAVAQGRQLEQLFGEHNAYS